MIQFLTMTEMQSYVCICSGRTKTDNETSVLAHMRQRHPHICQCMIYIRRRGKGAVDLEQLDFPSNSYLNYSQIEKIKLRVSKLAHIRSRLPPDPVLLDRREKIREHARRFQMNKQHAEAEMGNIL